MNVVQFTVIFVATALAGRSDIGVTLQHWRNCHQHQQCKVCAFGSVSQTSRQMKLHAHIHDGPCQLPLTLTDLDLLFTLQCLALFLEYHWQLRHSHLVNFWGWSGVEKVSCILRHRGIHLIMAYSWARPAILVAGKGRGGMFLFLLFLHFHSVPLSSLSLSVISSTTSFLSFSGRQHKMTHKGWRVVKPQHN